MDKTQIELRVDQIKENYKSLPKLEDIYYKVCQDYALLSDCMPKYIKKSQDKKKQLKQQELKTMAEFNREYELGAEFLWIKSTKYQMKAYERLLSGLKMRIESLKAGMKGQY